MDRGGYTSPSIAQKTTLGELIQRYMVEVLPSMRGAPEDSIRLKAICRRPICKYSITALTPAKFADYRDQRLKEVAPGTVIRELAYFSSIINHGRMASFRLAPNQTSAGKSSGVGSRSPSTCASSS